MNHKIGIVKRNELMRIESLMNFLWSI